MATEHPIVIELAKVQYDLTSLKARVSEIQRQAASLDLAPPDEHVCPEPDCGLVLRSAYKLAEHAYTSHDSPEPGHWREAEDKAA